MASQGIRVRENSLDVKSASESDFARVVGANGKSYRVEMSALKSLIASVIIDGSTEDLQEAIDAILEKADELEARLKSGSIEDADLHLGFYLDADGDLCQVDEEAVNG